jgi:hypothetical protein
VVYRESSTILIPFIILFTHSYILTFTYTRITILTRELYVEKQQQRVVVVVIVVVVVVVVVIVVVVVAVVAVVVAVAVVVVVVEVAVVVVVLVKIWYSIRIIYFTAKARILVKPGIYASNLSFTIQCCYV